MASYLLLTPGYSKSLQTTRKAGEGIQYTFFIRDALGNKQLSVYKDCVPKFISLERTNQHALMAAGKPTFPALIGMHLFVYTSSLF